MFSTGKFAKGCPAVIPAVLRLLKTGADNWESEEFQGFRRFRNFLFSTSSAMDLEDHAWYFNPPVLNGEKKSASSAVPLPGRRCGSDATVPGIEGPSERGGVTVSAEMMDEDKMADVYCGFCGAKLGQVESPAGRAGFYCPKCKTDLIAVLKEEKLTFTRVARRAKRQVPVNA